MERGEIALVGVIPPPLRCGLQRRVCFTPFAIVALAVCASSGYAGTLATHLSPPAVAKAPKALKVPKPTAAAASSSRGAAAAAAAFAVAEKAAPPATASKPTPAKASAPPADFVKAAKYTQEDLVKSFGFVEEKMLVKFRSKSSDVDWFCESKIPGKSYGKCSRKQSFVIPSE